MQNLLDSLAEYTNRNPNETSTVRELIELIRSKGTTAFLRSEWGPNTLAHPWHVTGSLLVTNTTRNQFLLMRHKSLGVLLQFGGHCDWGVDTEAVARREAHEESWIKEEFVIDPKILNIDIHVIPENPKKGEPEHYHYDMLYLWTAATGWELHPDEIEVDMQKGPWVAWYTTTEALAQVNSERLQRIIRMVSTGGRPT